MPTDEYEHLGEEHDELLQAWRVARNSATPTLASGGVERDEVGARR
jgi:hypothetical protein